MDNKIKFRHEEKYFLNYPEAALLRQRLIPFMEHDSHTESDGSYIVRSLYFDDYFHSAYREKEAGVFSRKKYRIRIYNYSDSAIFFERKLKHDNYIYKQAEKLTRREAERIIDGDISFLEHSSSDLMREIYYEFTGKLLRPRVIVDYDREPLTMDGGNVRITFDTHVRGSGNRDIFDPQIPTIDVIPGNVVILEVKYTEFLPNIVRRNLPPKGAENSAISKFMLCCNAFPQEGELFTTRAESIMIKPI